MAKWRFSSKSQSSGGSSSKEVKQISGSLAKRVLLVCAVLMVAPLVLHSIYLFHQELHLKTRDLISILEITAKEKTHSLESFIRSKMASLEILGMSFDWQGIEGGDKQAALDTIAKEQQLTSLFFQKMQSAEDFICTYSLQREDEGKNNLFLHEMQSVLTQGRNVFFADEQIYCSQVVHSSDAAQSVGVLTLGVNAQHTLDSLMFVSKTFPYHFKLSLISAKGGLLATTDAKMTSEQVVWLDVTASSNEKNVSEEEDRLLSFKKAGKTVLGIKIPVAGTDCFLLLTTPEQAVLNLFHREIFSSFSVLLLFIIVIGGGGTIVLTWRMSRPSQALNALMERVAKVDFSGRYQKHRLGFEVNVLGEHFNQMIESLLKKIEEVKQERLAKDILAQELQIGHQIQQSIFPKEVPDFAGLEISTGFWPAKEVAGDFYDLFVKKEQEQLLLAIADAAGKGISACLYALLLRSILRSYGAISDDLSEILTETNRLFCLDTGDSGFFATAWVGLYDAKKRLLHYLCCGHHPAILYRQDQTIVELTTPGIALGVIPYENIVCAQIQLLPGDLLILYTDGVVEAHDPSNQLFGQKRLFEIVRKEGRQSPQLFIEKLLAEVSSFIQTAPLHDDLTLVAIKVL